ncbi:MAG: electron transport complex subunit RsxB [Pseudomonadales bacterium]|nr:electron transport complex subunit RsxB [Pseudomonadales bacterium]
MDVIIELGSATLMVTTIGFTTAFVLSLAARRYQPQGDTVVDRINRELPQTQCAQCGYPGCRPYAEAIANGEAINKCPPGGDATITRLAEILGRNAEPLDPELSPQDTDHVAVIIEEDCIGCTLCIQACPVDAIIGASRFMHTVIEAECTGCELCVEPCPVDCIEMVRHGEPEPTRPPINDDAAMPCIHCDRCEPVCPRDLQPQLLHWYLDSPAKLESLRLEDCIVCGRCDSVCPSQIPLAREFGRARLDLKEYRQQQTAAARFEERYRRKQAREAEASSRIRARPDRQDRAALIQSIKRDVSS